MMPGRVQISEWGFEKYANTFEYNRWMLVSVGGDKSLTNRRIVSSTGATDETNNNENQLIYRNDIQFTV